MSFGKNLQYLRRLHGGMTQEKLAERMGVSRQTISKWESDESWPEIGKLIELCDFFSCKLDALIREDLAARSDIYSEVLIERIPTFRMARYVIISPNPEDDANDYMKRWAQKNNIENPQFIGWDFPFVSAEQKNRFGLRGYVSACVLPKGYNVSSCGAEIAEQQAADYATITIRDPFKAPFETIPRAYQIILQHLNCNGFRDSAADDILQCFEYIWHEDDTEYMKVHILVSGVNKADLYTSIG